MGLATGPLSCQAGRRAFSNFVPDLAEYDGLGKFILTALMDFIFMVKLYLVDCDDDPITTN
jgi:hypothetical protein